MNSSKTLFRRILLAMVFIGFAFFLIFIFYFFAKKSIQSDSMPLVVENTGPISIPEQANLGLPIDNVLPSKEAIAVVGLPVRLRIPKINIDTNIEYVGLTSKGEVDAPKGPINVGWFGFGSRPGETGNAIVVGHYGWKDNIQAVFDNLYKLKSGDKIYTEDDKGVIATFIVRESKRYNPDADASDVFISNDGKSHLNLITCEGIWNKVLKSYSKRLVVFADKVTE